MMNTLLFILILLACPRVVLAQNAYAIEDSWQLSLDVIKAKSQQLVVENKQLTTAQLDLIAGRDKLKASAEAIAKANQQLADFLKQRNGKTDQQAQLEEIKAKIAAHQLALSKAKLQLADINKQTADVVRRMNIKKLRIADWEIRKKAKEDEVQLKQSMINASVPTDEDIRQLRQDLEKQKAAEAALEAQINELTRANTNKTLDAGALKESNARLQAQVEALQKEINYRNQAAKEPSENRAKLTALAIQKKALEDKINQVEARINALKNPTNFTLTWEKERKRMVHEMVVADASNQRLKDKVDNLKEDINVLRDQVAKLERRINFGQGKGKTKE